MTDGEITTGVLAFVLVLTRVAAFVGVLPVFSKQFLPRTVKIGLVFALTLLWWETTAVPAPTGTAEATIARVATQVVKEGCLGAALGFLMGLFLFPAQVAGAWLGQELGLSMASMADPVTQENSSLVTQLLTAVATLLFLAGNLHHAVFAALGYSFERIPFGAGLGDRPFAAIAVDSLAVGHEQGMAIAAPVGVLLFLITVMLFLMNRASPQLNLFSIGLSLRLAAGFVALLILFPETCILLSQSLSLMTRRLYSVL